jgi:ribosomal protein S18 acetylase RimI-like enzyme
MLAKEREQILTPDAAVPSGCAVRLKQALLDPIDNGSRINLKKPTDFVGRKDALDLRLCNHAARKNPLVIIVMFNFPMEIAIREWNLADLHEIQESWLDFCRNSARSDMKLRSDPERHMAEWLMMRYRRPDSFGFIADRDGAMAGFLIGRVDEWESAPPIIEPRRLGIIDAVHVREDYRRLGVASQLIAHAVDLLRARRVAGIETTYDAGSDAEAETWNHAGFVPWMVHAFRLL